MMSVPLPPKMHLSMSLDTNALSAAQISGATEVLLVNKLLNQCLGSLTLSFSSDSSSSYMKNSPDFNRTYQRAKRKLTSNQNCAPSTSFYDTDPILQRSNGGKRSRTVEAQEASPQSARSVQSCEDVGEESEPLDSDGVTISTYMNQQNLTSMASETKLSRVVLCDETSGDHTPSIEPFHALRQVQESNGVGETQNSFNVKSEVTSDLYSDEFLVRSESYAQTTCNQKPCSSSGQEQAMSNPALASIPVDLSVTNIAVPQSKSEPSPMPRLVPAAAIYVPNSSSAISPPNSVFYQSESAEPNHSFSTNGFPDFTNLRLPSMVHPGTAFIQDMGSKLKPSAELVVGVGEPHAVGEGVNKYYSCSLCTYKSSRPELVKSHLRNYHSSLRPFKCVLCSHSCKTKCNLISHYRGLHRMEIEDARRYAKCGTPSQTMFLKTPQFLPRDLVVSSDLIQTNPGPHLLPPAAASALSLHPQTGLSPNLGQHPISASNDPDLSRVTSVHSTVNLNRSENS